VLAGVSAVGATGGAVRAHHVFGALGARTGGRVLAGYGRRGVPALARAIARASGGWRHPVAVASTQLLPSPAMALLHRGVHGAVLDLHDHPTLQAESLGIHLPADRKRHLDRLVAGNLARFERIVAPSASFAELCRLDPDQVVVVTNGADTGRITARAPHAEPVVGMVSGAAPGRGIEQLAAAMARVREEVPEARLRLALSPTGPASADYLRHLAADARSRQPWLSVESVPYARLDAFLGDAAVLVIPHPPGAYFDASTPVKLFDSMAAGRPLAVTPRTETRRIVEDCRAGVVAASDGVDDLAQAIATLLGSETLRAELGANARRAAVEHYDWRVLSAALADAVLGA
jgi:glycosyltransferase involved in cell wall biosynthesis